MRLVHFSDTHLGFNDLDIVDEFGINQREADFYSAFSQVTDRILEIKPNYVIHTGNIFHRPHPSNRAISFCLSELKRLSLAKIKTVIIAGNHSTPRTKTSSPILAALRTLDYVYTVFEERYETVCFDDVAFHCVPHIHDENANLKAIEECEASLVAGKKNVLLLHTCVGNAYMMEEYGERVYPQDKEVLFAKMDYVALGHWHGFGSVGKHKNVYYAGSTERTSSADARNEKGFAVVELGDELKVEFKQIKIRPSLRIKIDANASEDTYAQLDRYSTETDTAGALLYIMLENLSATQSIDISNSSIENYFQQALSVQIQRKFRASDAGKMSESVSSASLQEFFGAFLQEQCGSSDEFARLNSKVSAMFAVYDEANNDA